MTSTQIQKMLVKRGIAVSSSTVQRSHKQQGWTLQEIAYCQLIHDANKVKRLEYTQRIMESGDAFDNIIFSDESFISLVQYQHICYKKVDKANKAKTETKASAEGSWLGRN